MNEVALQIIATIGDELQMARDEVQSLKKELETVKESLKTREDDAIYWYRKYEEVRPPEQPKIAEEIKEVCPF